MVGFVVVSFLSTSEELKLVRPSVRQWVVHSAVVVSSRAHSAWLGQKNEEKVFPLIE